MFRNEIIEITLTALSMLWMCTRALAARLGRPMVRTMRSLDLGQHSGKTFTSHCRSCLNSFNLLPPLPMTQPA